MLRPGHANGRSSCFSVLTTHYALIRGATSTVHVVISTVELTVNSFGRVGVTCPVNCPVANYFFFSFQELSSVLRSSPGATSSS